MKELKEKEARMEKSVDSNVSPLLEKKVNGDQSKSDPNHILQEERGLKDPFVIKVIQTLILFYAFIAMGLSGAIVGPTLMDIEKLTNSNTETVSWIMTARCLGGILGVIIMGAIFTKGNPWLLMGVANLTAGIMLMVTPLFRNIIIMCVFYVIHGVGRWFVDGGCNVMILAVWGLENGPWMQGLHCSSGIGSLLAPVVAAPFLSSRHKTYDEEEIFSNGTLKVYLPNQKSLGNDSSTYETNSVNLPTNSTSTPQGSIEQTATSIFIAYFIVSLSVVFSALAFFFLFLMRNRIKGIKRTSVHVTEDEKITEYNEEKKKDQKEPKSNLSTFNFFNMSPERVYHMRMLFLVALFDVIQCLVTINYGNFVFTFAVKYLNWNKSQAVMVTSTYWGAFTSARVMAIFLSKFLHPRNLMLLCLFVGLVSSGVLLFFAQFHPLILWICTIGYGFAMSPLFATSVSLLGRYISVSSPEGATLVMSTIIGEMTGPVLVGVLFNRYGPLALVYVMVIVQCILLVVSAIIYFSGRNKVESRSHDSQGSSMTEVNVAEQRLTSDCL